MATSLDREKGAHQRPCSGPKVKLGTEVVKARSRHAVTMMGRPAR
jgi:hypothetical protein